MLPNLAFVSASQNSYYQDVLLGIVETLEEEGLFHLQSWQGNHVISSAALQYIEVDAVVTTSWDPNVIRRLPGNTPVFGVSNAKAEAEFPRVVNDDYAVGRVAAEAMLDAGYERLLLLKNLDHHHVRLRCQGVAEAAERHDLPVQTYELLLRKPLAGETFGDVLRESRQALQALAGELRPGTGVLAVQNNVAAEFLSVFEKASGLRIPEDLGLLVMDQNAPDEHRMACIELNGREIGRRAVRALDALLKGGAAPGPGSLVAVPPLGIRYGQTLRRGEGVMLYQQLCQIFRADLAGEHRMESVARTLGLSRRSLEMKLKVSSLPAPYELLTRLRLQRSEELLKSSELPLEEIAESCGFANARSLTERFRAYHGMTPFAYRKKSRGLRH